MAEATSPTWLFFTYTHQMSSNTHTHTHAHLRNETDMVNLYYEFTMDMLYAYPRRPGVGKRAAGIAGSWELRRYNRLPIGQLF